MTISMFTSQTSSRQIVPLNPREKRTNALRVVWLATLILISVWVPSSFAEDEAKTITPKGTISDVNKKPLEGVQVTLHRWDGVFSDPIASTTTDAKGNFVFPSRANDAYYYVILRKQSFAAIDQMVSVDGPIKATLRSSTQSWINVESTSGQALAGAKVVNISIHSDDNSQAYIWRGVEHLFEMKFDPSDASGRLMLPPLPEGATVDIRLDHPQQAPILLKNLQVNKGQLGTASMVAGVMTTFEFVVDDRAPASLDGKSCEVLLMARSSGSGQSINVAMPIIGNRLQFCAHPTNYDMVRLSIPGFTITPNYESMTIDAADEKKAKFLLRKQFKVTGRVTHPDGSPHPEADVLAMTQNLLPDGSISSKEGMTFCNRVETDAEGRYSIDLPAGMCRIEIDAKGFVSNRDYVELEVKPDQSNQGPDFVVKQMEPIRGKVTDEQGLPVPNAIVRVRNTRSNDPAQVTDAEGQFTITLRGVPKDYETRRGINELAVVAFTTDRPLMGETKVDLSQTDSVGAALIKLKPDLSPTALLSMEDNKEQADNLKKFRAENPRDPLPAGEPGKAAPELDGAAWLNTDARSLKDFRGQYVLLDFWFIGCGPCHADLPNVKLVHERFAKQGVTVIGVHDNSSSPAIVQEFCQKHGINYPTVVDHKDGRIVDAYRSLGLDGFPTYMLIDPEGKIVINDRTTEGPSLRRFKVELVRQILNERAGK